MKTSAQLGPVGAFFLITFVFSWACWAPQVLSHFGFIHARFSPTSLLQLLGDFGPTVGALGASVRDPSALRRLRLAAWRWKLPLKWYAASLFVPVATILSASAVRAVVLHTGLQITLANIPRPAFLHGGPCKALVALASFAIGMFIFAAAEETGWRGFALPRLIASLGFLRAAVLLGVMWGLWHFPLAVVDGNPLHDESLLLFTASTVLSSLLLAYIWVHTRSLLLAIVFHAANNLTFFLLEPTATVAYRTASALICVLAIACFWRPSRFDQSQANAVSSSASVPTR